MRPAKFPRNLSYYQVELVSSVRHVEHRNPDDDRERYIPEDCMGKRKKNLPSWTGPGI
jgi:hypothetical protein